MHFKIALLLLTLLLRFEQYVRQSQVEILVILANHDGISVKSPFQKSVLANVFWI